MWQMVIPAIVGAVAGQLGPKGDPGAQAEQDAALRAALQAYAGIEIPEYVQFTPEMYEYAGNLLEGIEKEKEVTLGPSAMEGVASDPRLKEMQMQTLAKLAEVGEGGMDPAYMAAMQQARRSAASETQAQERQLQQEMQQRGQGGGGSELAARLQAISAGADRQGAMGLDISQDLQQRALEAMLQRGQMAGNVRGQEFDEKSRVAQARDMVNQFNTQNAVARERQYAAARNQARQRDLEMQQRMAQDKAALANQARMENWARQNTVFQNEMARAAGLSGAYQNRAAQYGDRAAAAAEGHAKQRGGFADIAGSVAKYALGSGKAGAQPQGQTWGSADYLSDDEIDASNNEFFKG